MSVSETSKSPKPGEVWYHLLWTGNPQYVLILEAICYNNPRFRFGKHNSKVTYWLVYGQQHGKKRYRDMVFHPNNLTGRAWDGN